MRRNQKYYSKFSWKARHILAIDMNNLFRHCLFQNDTTSGNVWYTRGRDAVYAIAIGWPEEEVLRVNGFFFLAML